jgi:SPP1 gp7 family putative phage head morphogenesis protein
MPYLVGAGNELQAAALAFIDRIDTTIVLTEADVLLGNRLFAPAVEAYLLLREPMRTALFRGAEEQYSLVEQHLTLAMPQLSARLGFAGGFPRAERVFMTDAGRRTLLEQYDAVSRRYGDNVRFDIRQQLKEGVKRGETFDQLTRRIVRHVAPPSEFPVALGNRYWDQARRIVRTEVMNAYNQATVDAVKELARVEPELQLRWLAAIDGRTCSVCRSMDGVAIGAFESFSAGPPPAHPNCRCIVTAWMSEWSQQRRAA